MTPPQALWGTEIALPYKGDREAFATVRRGVTDLRRSRGNIAQQSKAGRELFTAMVETGTALTLDSSADEEGQSDHR
jgi:hypothetical protein